MAAIVLIVFFFPKGGKFKYDFQKGKPWQYENLYAPFDFSIKKTDEEEKAIEFLEKADAIILEQNINTTEAEAIYFDLSNNYQLLGRYDSALISIDKLMKVQRNNPTTTLRGKNMAFVMKAMI